jgi:hypothetical protein
MVPTLTWPGAMGPALTWPGATVPSLIWPGATVLPPPPGPVPRPLANPTPITSSWPGAMDLEPHAGITLTNHGLGCHRHSAPGSPSDGWALELSSGVGSWSLSPGRRASAGPVGYALPSPSQVSSPHQALARLPHSSPDSVWGAGLSPLAVGPGTAPWATGSLRISSLGRVRARLPHVRGPPGSCRPLSSAHPDAATLLGPSGCPTTYIRQVQAPGPAAPCPRLGWAPGLLPKPVH